MKLNLKKSSGFTLVELLLVVGIIALGSVVAYITLPKVQSTSRANAEAANINTLAAGVKNMYAGTNSYRGLLSQTIGTDLIIKAKAAPAGMVVGTTLRNSFGGTVTVEPGQLLGSVPADGSFHITYNGVPDAECNKIVSIVGNNFMRITAGPFATQAIIKSAPGEGAAPAISPSAVAAACNYDNNTIGLWSR